MRKLAIYRGDEFRANGVQLAGAAAPEGSDVILIHREGLGFLGGINLPGEPGNGVIREHDSFHSTMVPAGFDWRLREQAKQEVFGDLVVVRFKGRCILEPVGYLIDERGPLAFTYSTGGLVQPYSEVACDKVTASVRSAMFGGDFAKADELLGRALGRVVAHELVHMLSKSGAHGREGIGKAALSGKGLISPELRLDAADLERLHTTGH